MQPLNYSTLNFLGPTVGPTLKRAISYFLSPQLQAQILPIKIIFLGLTVLFLWAIIYFLLNTNYLTIRYGEDWIDFHSFKDYGLGRDVKKWLKIKKRLGKNLPASNKLAIIEAVKFLDSVLQKLGYGKETAEERFQELRAKNTDFSLQISQLIRIYQDILRDPDLVISQDKSLEVVNNIEKILNKLKVF